MNAVLEPEAMHQEKPPAKRKAPATVEPVELVEIKISVPANLLEQIKQYRGARGSIKTDKLGEAALARARQAYVDSWAAVLDKDEEFQLSLVEDRKAKGVGR